VAPGAKTGGRWATLGLWGGGLPRPAGRKPYGRKPYGRGAARRSTGPHPQAVAQDRNVPVDRACVI